MTDLDKLPPFAVNLRYEIERHGWVHDSPARLADDLRISADLAMRRYLGETDPTDHELEVLSRHFRVDDPRSMLHPDHIQRRQKRASGN